MMFMFELYNRIKPAGEPPSPRAAHTAAAVGTMVVFQVSGISQVMRKHYSTVGLFWFCFTFDEFCLYC